MEKPSTRICAEALQTFGPDVQMNLAQEECAVLILEINKLRRGTGSVAAVAGELAAVSILLEQLELTFSAVVELRWQKNWRRSTAR